MAYQGLMESYLGRAGQAMRGAQGALGATATKAGGLADTAWGDYQKNVQPTQAAARKAALYRPDLANRAGVDAQMATDNAMGAMSRNLSRMGINPASGRYAGLMTETALTGAANKAGAMNRARMAEREGEFGRLVTASGLGAELPGITSNMMSQSASASANAANMAPGMMSLAGDYGLLAQEKRAGEGYTQAKRKTDAESRMSDMQAFIQGMSSRTPKTLFGPTTYRLR